MATARKYAGVLPLSIAVVTWLWPFCLGALEIEFDFRFDREGFFASAERRAALERAAQSYEDRIDGLLAPLESGEWIAELPLPETGELVTVNALEVAQNTLMVFVGARSLAEQGRLALGGPGAWRVPCAQLFGFPMPHCELDFEGIDAAVFFDPLYGWMERVLFRGRPSAQRFPAEGFAPWGGFLVFDAHADWYFGLDARVPAQRPDFVSAAIHELGHVFGVGTAESWGTHTPGRDFEGEQVQSLVGGPAALAPDLAHWRATTQSVGDLGTAAAAFNPGLAAGERRDLTALDVAALVDIGWSLLRDIAMPGAVPFAYEEPFAGDLNRDGQLDARDVAILEAYFEAPLTEREFVQADVSPQHGDGSMGDGLVDSFDVALLGQALTWLDDAADGTLVHPHCLEFSAGWCEPPFALLPLPPLETLDEEALRLLGWEFDGSWPPVVRSGGLRGGDLNDDGKLDAKDLARVMQEANRARLGDPGALAAADVAPLVDGNSQGDGAVDAADLALLRRAAQEPDIDGDGFATELENAMNEIWIQTGLGRPRHRPLTRWTDECLVAIEVESGQTVLEVYLLGFLGGGAAPPELRFDFCSRDGSPWSTQPAVSGDQYRAIRRSARRTRPAPTGEGSGAETGSGPGSDDASEPRRSGGFGWRAPRPEASVPPQTVEAPKPASAATAQGFPAARPEPAQAESRARDDAEWEVPSAASLRETAPAASEAAAEPAHTRFWRAVERLVASLIQAAWSLVTAWLAFLE